MASKRKADGESKSMAKKSKFTKKNSGVVGVPLATRGFRSGFGTAAGELKAFDVLAGVVDAVPNAPAGSIFNIHLPVVGADFNNRIGRKTTATKIYIRGLVGIKNVMVGAGPAVAYGAANLIRMIIFVDWQPNGAKPLHTDILAANGGNTDAASQLNLNNRERFKILKDKQWTVDPVLASGAFNRTTIPVKVFKKVQIDTIFGTSGGTVADITSGAIYVMFTSLNAVGAQPAAAYISSRVRYMDA